jgi:SOS response regulatory protein OraA/RecX
MKIISELKKRKISIVKIDKSLNKYDDIVIFPEKLDKANKKLSKSGLPKQWSK